MAGYNGTDDADRWSGTAFADFAAGLAGNDILSGLDGDDTLDGGEGNDRLSGGEGADTLIGGFGADRLDGGAGRDTIYAGSGSDIVSGGAGHDQIIVVAADTDVLEIDAGDDDDRVTLTGGRYGVLRGGAGDDAIGFNGAILTRFGTGNGFERLIAGSTVRGTGKDDKLDFASLATVTDGIGVRAGGGEDQVTGTARGDALHGDAGNDRLVGGAGDDRLDGGTGADAMIGDAGDDRYIVDDAGDRVIERDADPVFGGRDTVESAIDYALGDYVEDLALVGRALRGTGNALANAITGNDHANTLRGLDGNDTLAAGAGRDVLRGDGGDDYLDGGIGADRMLGGLGRDTYVIDEAGDTIVESGGDVDVVHLAAAIAYTLPAGVEDAVVLAASTDPARLPVVDGNALANRLIGGDGAERLYGQGGDDLLEAGAGGAILDGGIGDDILIGGSDSDVLYGGTGSDSYVFFRLADLGGDFITDALDDPDDHIDLSAIDADPNQPGRQAFTFIGTDSFSGRPGEIRYLGQYGAHCYTIDEHGELGGNIVFYNRSDTLLTADDFVL